MFKNFLLTSFLLFSSFISIYPSKKENTDLIDYCYSLEKILAINSLERSKNFFLKRYKNYAKDFTSFGTNKTKGALVNKIIDEYKTYKKSYIVNIVPNQFVDRILDWKSKSWNISIYFLPEKQTKRQYKNTKKELDELIKDINFEYKSIKKEINDFLEG